MSHLNPRTVQFADGAYLVYFAPDATSESRCSQCDKKFLQVLTFKAMRVVRGVREILSTDPAWQRAASQAVPEENKIHRAYLKQEIGSLCKECADDRWNNPP